MRSETQRNKTKNSTPETAPGIRLNLTLPEVTLVGATGRDVTTVGEIHRSTPADRLKAATRTRHTTTNPGATRPYGARSPQQV